MFWILALVIVALAAAEGYFIGAIRAAFALVGLVLAAFLAVPLAPLTKAFLGLFGVHHFVTLAYVGPVVVWLVLVLAVRAAGESINYKVNYFYKYKVGDEVRLFWQRLMQRIGACIGVLNGALYFFAFCVLAYCLGYPAVQMASSDQDPFILRVSNQLGVGLASSGMDRAVGPFVPTEPLLYDTSDLVGTVYQNPTVQIRLGKYPPFLPLMERPEFKELSRDRDFQTAWKSHPPFASLLANPKIAPLVTNQDTLELVRTTVGSDWDDLQEYLQTGKSPKYGDLLIVGKWAFAPERSFKATRKLNPSIPAATLRTMLDTAVPRSTSLTAFLDGQLAIRGSGSTNREPAARGTWKQNNRHSYVLNVTEGGNKYKTEADVEDHRATFTRETFRLVFLK